MDNLEKLAEKCKGEVIVRVNSYKSMYQNASQYIETLKQLGCYDVEKDVEDQIIKSGNVVEVIFYPDTPVGHYSVTHYDIKTAIYLALEIMEG